MKKIRFEEKSKLRGKLKTPQILTKETYIMRGFLMEKGRICLVIVMLTTKGSSNFNRGIVNFEGILNEKSKLWRKK